MMKLFHVTSSKAVDLILATGFHDGPPRMMGTNERGDVYVRGVWFSDAPTWDGGHVDLGALPDNLACIAVDARAGALESYEIVNEGGAYREWCIPAAIANTFPRARATRG